MEVKETLNKATDETTLHTEEQVLSATEQQLNENTEATDYSKFSEVELINALRDLLTNNDDELIRSEVELIRNAFYKRHNAQVELEKEAFVANGGDAKDFQSSNAPYSKDIKALLSDYRQQRAEKAKQLEAERENNLVKKQNIVEQIKQLIEKEESLNNTFQEFNELQKQWREIGQVPQIDLQDLWDSYHHNVEKFYDYIRINKELRDLDFQRNLEAKRALCVKTEGLADETSVDRARADLQSYHEQWREIGPVPREERDALWDRFKAASSAVNKRHQDFYMKRKEDETQNLAQKVELCEKVESFINEAIDGHKQWDEYVEQIKTIQTEWRTIGYAPKKDNNKIYERFCEACDAFFDKRRNFYNQQKEEQKVNLKRKEELCEKAEVLQTSEDWKATTDNLIQLQNDWKKIGPTSRKQADAVWARFRAACDAFFENKAAHFSSSDSVQVENLNKKQALIDEISSYKFSDNVEQSFADLKEFQQRWSEIGHVPFKQKDEIIKKFRKAINVCYDKLKVSSKEKNTLLFKNKIEELSEANSHNKIRQEREKILTKIKYIERELATLERNISFFGNSKGANALVADVQRKIDQAKLNIKEQQEKLKILRNIDN
ncbi:MAG: DUF349 domain-containing protein [Mangrovibacterium sp.]